MEPDLIDVWECVDPTALNDWEPIGPPPADVLRAFEALTAEVTALRAAVATGAPSPSLAMGSPTTLLTTKEAARHIRLSPKALYQRVARGQLKASHLGRALRFRRADLDALMRPLAP
jgi:excisionase family DNA binding protein